MSQEKYIGMDVYQATISVAVMDASGKLIMECLLETKTLHVIASSGWPKSLNQEFGFELNGCIGNWICCKPLAFRSTMRATGGTVWAPAVPTAD